MGNSKSAIDVLRAAAKLAKTPQESQTVDKVLTNVQAYAAAQERIGEQNRQTDEEMKAGQDRAQDQDGPDGNGPPRLAHRKEFVPSGPHRFVVGVLKGVATHPTST